MAVTHSKAAREAMDRAVLAQAEPEKRHKVIAYYDSDKGLKARLVEPREGDDVSALLKLVVGPKVSYLGHESQDDCLRARAAAQGMDAQAFIHQRLAWIASTHGVGQPAKRVDAVRKAMEGEWLTGELQKPNDWFPRESDIFDIKPTETPYMELARQAMAGRDFERKLEQVRKDQEELCGVKVSLDPAVGCDDFTMQRFVISGGRRAGKTSGLAAMIADAQRTATKSTEQMLIDAMQKLWGEGKPVATVHDVQYDDPSAERDALAAARVGGFNKPVNRPHKDEKPANPYPPAHPKAEAPAGLMAVAPMDFRMGNRWMP